MNGRGVYYGASRSEAVQCGGEPVTVVGAGNSAGQAVLNLAGAAAYVTMLVRGDSLGKSMSAYLVRRIEQNPMIDVRLQSQLTAVEGDDGRLVGIGFADGEKEDAALETGLYNLTQDEAPALLHFGTTQTTPILLVRFKAPE